MPLSRQGSPKPPPPPPTRNGSSDDEPSKVKSVLCPYCGLMQQTPVQSCSACGGRFDEMSRLATQSHMGPWQVRDEHRPFAPGFDDATLRRLCERGQIKLNTVIRGPTTNQFWTLASNAPLVAALLGQCHACHTGVLDEHTHCPSCGVELRPGNERNTLGLIPLSNLPGGAKPEGEAGAALEHPDVQQDAAPDRNAGGRRDELVERRLRNEIRYMHRRMRTLRLVALALAVVGVLLAGSLVIWPPPPLRTALQSLDQRVEASVGTGTASADASEAREAASAATDRRNAAEEAPPSASKASDGAQGVGHEESTPSAADDGVAAPASWRPGPPDTAWSEDYERALMLEARGTIEALEEAEQLLVEIRDNLPAVPVGVADAANPWELGTRALLTDKIERVRRRLREQRAHDALHSEG